MLENSTSKIEQVNLRRVHAVIDNRKNVFSTKALKMKTNYLLQKSCLLLEKNVIIY